METFSPAVVKGAAHPCLKLSTDFIYSGAGEYGRFVHEVRGIFDPEVLPRIIPVRPGLYLSLMGGRPLPYSRIDFRIGNAPVSVAMMLSGSFYSRFLDPQQKGDSEVYIGPGTCTVCSLRETSGQMHIDPAVPFICVELIIDPHLLRRYFPETRGKGMAMVENVFDPLKGIASFHLDPVLRQTALEILHPPESRGPFLDLFYESRALTLLSRQLELFGDPSFFSGLFPRDKGVSEKLEHARAILSARFDDPPTIPALARQCGLNEFRLKKEFKRVFHTTIYAFVQKRRMERAHQLIREENFSVSEAAHAVGYINVSHFSNAFKKQFMINPSTLKKATHPLLHRKML